MKPKCEGLLQSGVGLATAKGSCFLHLIYSTGRNATPDKSMLMF